VPWAPRPSSLDLPFLGRILSQSLSLCLAAGFASSCPERISMVWRTIWTRGGERRRFGGEAGNSLNYYGSCYPLGELGSLRMRGTGIGNTVRSVVYQTNILHIYSFYSYIHLEHLYIALRLNSFLRLRPTLPILILSSLSSSCPWGCYVSSFAVYNAWSHLRRAKVQMGDAIQRAPFSMVSAASLQYLAAITWLSGEPPATATDC
jgi:hypothetical protein